MAKLLLAIALVLVPFVLATDSPSPTLARTVSFRSFDFPGANYTLALGINDSGEIVGFYGTASGEYGFLLNKNGTFTTISVPGASSTNALGISDSGEVVGSYVDTDRREHGFLWKQTGEFETLDYPSSNTCQTVAVGTSRGQIVGYYDISAECEGPDFAFVREANGTYLTIGNPFSNHSMQLNGINASDQFVGVWLDDRVLSKPHERGILMSKDGSSIQFSYPNAADTFAVGINQQGTITGFYLENHMDTFGPGHGFILDRNGAFTEIRYPNAVKTLVGEINASEEFVGGYAMSDGVLHGFVGRVGRSRKVSGDERDAPN